MTRAFRPRRPDPEAVRGTALRPRTTVNPAVSDLLLVADLPWVADAVRAALSDAAGNLTVTADPAAAPALALEQGAAVVLVDLQVGSMGGMAVTRALRAAARAAGVSPPAVVLLLDREADAFLAGRAAADGWIRKPFDAFALRRLVERLAEPRAEQRSNA
jgi:DNA-binding response OmpR family regulator